MLKCCFNYIFCLWFCQWSLFIPLTEIPEAASTHPQACKMVSRTQQHLPRSPSQANRLNSSSVRLFDGCLLCWTSFPNYQKNCTDQQKHGKTHLSALISSALIVKLFLKRSHPRQRYTHPLEGEWRYNFIMAVLCNLHRFSKFSQKRLQDAHGHREWWRQPWPSDRMTLFPHL